MDTQIISVNDHNYIIYTGPHMVNAAYSNCRDDQILFITEIDKEKEEIIINYLFPDPDDVDMRYKLQEIFDYKKYDPENQIEFAKALIQQYHKIEDKHSATNFSNLDVSIIKY